MSNEQNKLTDEEMEDFQRITADTLANICAMADKYNIDRDSMLKYFSGMLTAFTEVASIQNYETNHNCNCQHNNACLFLTCRKLHMHSLTIKLRTALKNPIIIYTYFYGSVPALKNL